jgi:hypothetical protein
VTVLPATKVPPTATPAATPTPDLAASLRASGLFSDEAGGTWRLVTGTDDVANKVLTRYVAGAVLSGEFAKVYHDAFGEPPPCSLMMQLAEDAE